MAKTKKNDPVNPNHYKQHAMECIEVFSQMNYPVLANALKYVWRAGDKGGAKKAHEDLDKAIWYIRYFIDNQEKKPNALIQNHDNLRTNVNLVLRPTMEIIRVNAIEEIINLDCFIPAPNITHKTYGEHVMQYVETFQLSLDEANESK